MLELLLIILAMTALFMGDIIWDFTSELIWHVGLRLPANKLNVDKRKRPKRCHYKYY